MAIENAAITKANCTRIVTRSTHIRNNANWSGPKTSLNSKILEKQEHSIETVAVVKDFQQSIVKWITAADDNDDPEDNNDDVDSHG